MTEQSSVSKLYRQTFGDRFNVEMPASKRQLRATWKPYLDAVLGFRNYWYPICLSHELADGEVVAQKICGEEIIVRRVDGEPYARLPPCQAAAGAKPRWVSLRVMSAQTMRAILLASATATSIRGLRASILTSQGSFVSPRLTAELTTAMAPMIKRRLRSRWPIFDILPSLGWPPVVCCHGTRPSRAKKSRPRRKLSIGGPKAWSAIAPIGPIPGIVISRAACSS